ncbi:transposase [Spiroplasma endosymbiont of Diplazon laetatorius]|uniref:transposase n=1 Tax=Spiroplasma endosymbiont of Diplazon laetatorius TaxID=3066322 RepID=UPI0030D115EF
MAKKGQKFKKYNKEFRIFIVNECLKENAKVAAIAIKFKINRNTIESWIRSYRFGKLNTKVGRPPGDETELLEFWKNKCELMEKSLASVMNQQEKKLKLSKSEERNIKLNYYLKYLKLKGQPD